MVPLQDTVEPLLTLHELLLLECYVLSTVWDIEPQLLQVLGFQYNLHKLWSQVHHKLTVGRQRSNDCIMSQKGGGVQEGGRSDGGKEV